MTKSHPEGGGGGGGGGEGGVKFSTGDELVDSVSTGSEVS